MARAERLTPDVCPSTGSLLLSRVVVGLLQIRGTLCALHSASPILEDGLEMILAVLESGFKVMELLVEIFNLLLDVCVLLCYACPDVGWWACYKPASSMSHGSVICHLGVSHLAYTFVDVCIFG